MISSKFFIDSLCSMQMDFFTGVPDSLLKNVCAYITDHFVTERNVIAANEGAAVGLAAGYYLAQKKYQLFICKIPVLAMLSIL